MVVFVKEVLLSEYTGMSFVDSVPLRVCNNYRVHYHKVFKEIAMRGKCFMGWFFGFKLHLIINERGGSTLHSPKDVDDRAPLKM